MSLISIILNKLTKKKSIPVESDESPLQVEVVRYAPPAKSGQPESQERKELLKRWLNAGEKPEKVKKMEKNMGAVLGEPVKGRLIEKASVVDIGKKVAQGTGQVIGSFGKGFVKGSGVKKPKKPTAYSIGHNVGQIVKNSSRQQKQQVASSPPVNPLAGFNTAFDGFDLSIQSGQSGSSNKTSNKSNKSRKIKSKALSDGFDQAFEGFDFKW